MATGLLVSRIQPMPIYGVSIASLSHWQDLGRAATRESRATTYACDNEVLHDRRLPARAVRCQGTHRRVRWSNVVRYSDIDRLRSGRTFVDLQNLNIVVPGSISNLGPGFDTLAVAVELFLRIRVLEVRSDAPDTLETVFPAGPPSGGNRIEVAWKLARERFGKPAPGLRIEVTSEIPVTAGLGSSAAAAVAGLQLYAAVTEARSVGDLLSMASELEGHPDNAAAALLGGMTVSCLRDDGRLIARSWLPPRGPAIRRGDTGCDARNLPQPARAARTGLAGRCGVQPAARGPARQIARFGPVRRSPRSASRPAAPARAGTARACPGRGAGD